VENVNRWFVPEIFKRNVNLVGSKSRKRKKREKSFTLKKWG